MQSPAENIARLTITDDLGKNLGPVLMGLATDALLSGVVLNQMVKWAPESGKDWTRVRWLMWSAFAGTVVTTVLTWTWSMHLFVYNFGQYSQFLSWEWSSWYGVLDMLIVMPIRIFFVERAYRISGRSNLLLFAMILCLLGAIVAGVGITATLFPLELLEVNKTSDVFILMCPSVCIAVDLMITVSISWGLYKSKTGWTHTDALIKKLIITTAEANVPGLLIAFAFFLHNMINRKSFFALFFMMVYSKPYIIGMLAVLNSKHEVEKTGTGKSTERSENKYSSRRSDPQQDTVPVSTGSNPFVDYYPGSGTDPRARLASDAGESVMMDRMGDTDSKTDLTRVERV